MIHWILSFLYVEIYFSGPNHHTSTGIVVRTTKINFHNTFTFLPTFDYCNSSMGCAGCWRNITSLINRHNGGLGEEIVVSKLYEVEYMH